MAEPVPEMREWGLPGPAELDSVVIVSPHLDDAVLGCGRLMAAHPGATVVTVYAGGPPVYPDPMTHWDTLAGFVAGDDVLAARREEDAAALTVLGATPSWLDFVEHPRFPEPAWLCYEDVGYKHIPGLLAWRVSQLFRRRLWPTPVAVAVDEHDTRKRAALDCYRSQLLALDADWQLGPKLVAPEQLWRLAPPPPGWEGLADDGNAA